MLIYLICATAALFVGSVFLSLALLGGSLLAHQNSLCREGCAFCKQGRAL